MAHIVVFSDDWGRHQSSSQHIFRHLLDKHNITWINTIGLRTMRLSMYDLKRTIQVLRSWASSKSTDGSTEKNETANPIVLAPIMLPSFRYRFTAYLNQKILLRTVRKALNIYGKNKKTVLVSTAPVIPDIYSSGIFDLTVYYCVDDFTTWPGVDGRAMQRLESELLRGCDLLIATSSELLRSRGALVKKASLLTHGVDFEHFSSASRLSQPDELKKLPKPVIGFFGVFDERMDDEVLKNIANQFASGSVAIIGPIDRDIKPFASFSNIHFFGRVSYQELPSWVAGFDACILPYKVNESTKSINPLKLKEYIATRKPVISAPLPEAVRLSKYVRIAFPEDFPLSVREEIEKPFSEDPDLEAFLHNESWEKKAEEFEKTIMEKL